MIRVLVVDDSAFMRRAITSVLEKDTGIKVVGFAKDGVDALHKIEQLDPDVVTLDIEMPRMDGLTALSHIMKEMPRPVLMVSALTTKGADITLKALEMGAVDFISKEMSSLPGIADISSDICAKVREIAKKRISSPLQKAGEAPPWQRKTNQRLPVIPFAGRLQKDIVVIGVSTGGPGAVQKLLSELPEEFPVGIVIAQHMPGVFTTAFARRLDGITALRVKEAFDGEEYKQKTVYIAPGGKILYLEARGLNKWILRVSEPSVDILYKPSVDLLIESVARVVGSRTLAVIMTGMGSDGLKGVKLLKEKGGRVLAQSEATCVVYGMPKVIVNAGLADQIVDIDDLASAISNNLYM